MGTRLRTFFQRPGATLSPLTRVPGLLLPDRSLAAEYSPHPPTMQSLQGGSRAVGMAVQPAGSRTAVVAPASNSTAPSAEDEGGDNKADRNDEE